MGSTLLALAVTLALVAELFAVSGRTYERGQTSAKYLTEPPGTKLDDRLLNILTMGWRGPYDDFVDIWELQMLMDQRGLRSPEELYTALTSGTKHHPKITSLYLLGCFVMINVKHPEYCEQLALDGLKGMPDSWRIAATQGYVEEKLMKHEEAAIGYYALAGAMPGVPKYIAEYAGKLKAKTPDAVRSDEILKGVLENQAGSRMGEYLEELRKK